MKKKYYKTPSVKLKKKNFLPIFLSFLSRICTISHKVLVRTCDWKNKVRVYGLLHCQNSIKTEFVTMPDNLFPKNEHKRPLKYSEAQSSNRELEGKMKSYLYSSSQSDLAETDLN